MPTKTAQPATLGKTHASQLRSVGPSRESVAPRVPNPPPVSWGRGAHPWGRRGPHIRCERRRGPRGVRRLQGAGGRGRVVDAAVEPQHSGLGGHGGLAGVQGAPVRPAVEQQQEAPVELERGRERVRLHDSRRKSYCDIFVFLQHVFV